MRIKSWSFLAAMLAALAPAAASAQNSSRPIAVPVDASWKHAGSGAVMPAAIDGIPRTAVSDLSNTQIDVVLQYERSDTQMTVFLFRPAVNSGPLWFDRTETIIGKRDIYGGVVPNGPVALFALPGSTVQNGMRRSYKPQGGSYAGTGVALVPFGEWLISIRISSTRLDPAAVDALLVKAVAAIGWPAKATAPAAVPIAPCAKPLVFGKATQLKAGGSALFGGLLSLGLGDKKDEPADVAAYCRDRDGDITSGVYRFLDTDAGYTIAFGDAGRVVTVLPDFLGKEGEYGVTLLNLTSAASYPGYKGLPAPETAFKMVTTTNPVSVTEKGSNTITVNSGALK